MRLSRLLRSIVIHPAFFIPALIALGAFEAATDPALCKELSALALKLWTPTAAPWIFGCAIFAALVVAAISLGFDLADRWTKKPADPAVDAEQPSAAEVRQKWVSDRLAPWRAFLDHNNALPLFGEIEARFNERPPFATPPVEAEQQDRWLVGWLTEQAIGLSRIPLDDLDQVTPDEHAAKIHCFVEEAFRLAGERDGWVTITRVPGAREVVAPIFRGQAAIYRSQCAGSQEFLGFTIWLLG